MKITNFYPKRWSNINKYNKSKLNIRLKCYKNQDSIVTPKGLQLGTDLQQNMGNEWILIYFLVVLLKSAIIQWWILKKSQINYPFWISKNMMYI